MNRAVTIIEMLARDPITWLLKKFESVVLDPLGDLLVRFKLEEYFWIPMIILFALLPVVVNFWPLIRGLNFLRKNEKQLPPSIFKSTAYILVNIFIFSPVVAWQIAANLMLPLKTLLSRPALLEGPVISLTLTIIILVLHLKLFDFSRLSTSRKIFHSLDFLFRAAILGGCIGVFVPGLIRMMF